MPYPSSTAGKFNVVSLAMFTVAQGMGAGLKSRPLGAGLDHELRLIPQETEEHMTPWTTAPMSQGSQSMLMQEMAMFSLYT